MGAVLLPGTAFVELALQAGQAGGAERIEELNLQAPLVFSGQGSMRIQVSLAPADERGARAISIHSRAAGQGEEAGAGEWTLNASGTLSREAPPAPEPLGVWPPSGAEPLDTEDFYERLSEVGFDYGPAFQALNAAWTDGEGVYSEVALPDDQREGAQGFAIHPALFDAAFHAAILAAAEGEEQAGPAMPFSWKGVSLSTSGARALRVALRSEGDRLSLQIADEVGAPLAQVDSLATRPVSSEQMRSAARPEPYRLDWAELDLPEAAEESGEPTIVDSREWTAGDPTEATRIATARALELIQAHLQGTEADDPLVFLTQGALAAAGTDPSPAAAALAGLVRSAQTEAPGRFAVVDSDGSDASTEALGAAVAASAEETQLALREGKALVARLAPVGAESAGTDAPEPPSLDPEKTTLITGGLSGLGALFARHLAEAHGARHLLLVSRSGEKAAGAAELRQELQDLGAAVTIATCDVSDRGQLEELFDSIPDDRPLGAIVHSAGLPDGGLMAGLDPERLDRVLAPKADAAWHLHELSAELGLSHFVLFASVAGPFGGLGQGSYAAANSFLDGLAQLRCEQGLTATAIDWGVWQREDTMTAQLSGTDLARMARSGVVPIPDPDGLALFDAVLKNPSAQTVAIALNRPALRSQASAGTLPPLFSGLVKAAGARSKAPSGQLAAQLAALPADRREAAVLQIVRTEVAAVLGHDSAAAIDPERPFKDLGFDSVAAVELRNRLAAATGVELTATMAFDYPTFDRACDPAAGAGAGGWAEQGRRGPRPGDRRADRDRRHGLPFCR